MPIDITDDHLTSFPACGWLLEERRSSKPFQLDRLFRLHSGSVVRTRPSCKRMSFLNGYLQNTASILIFVGWMDPYGYFRLNVFFFNFIFDYWVHSLHFHLMWKFYSVFVEKNCTYSEILIGIGVLLGPL